MEILDEALRGGKPARVLEQKCRQQLEEAEKEVQEAIDRAPEFITETHKRHNAYMLEVASLKTQLVMLDESLEDIAKSSAEMIERSKREAAKREALDDLATAIIPFVHVAEALNVSDHIPDLSFPQMESTLAALEAAVRTAQESGRAQLTRTIPELQERSDQVKATMKARYLDMFEVCPHSITIKLSMPADENLNHEAASQALANVDLLHEAIDAIVSELVRNDVAASLSRATSCSDKETTESYMLEWSRGSDDSGELLEFDLDDIEDANEAEVDAMSDNLDIANAAARALKVYDLFRQRVLGEAFSRDLAFALQSWFCNQVLPSSLVMSSRRVSGVPAETMGDTLHSRVAAVSVSANVIQSSIRARGVHSFVLIVEMDSLESKVGSECRAQAILKTRRAIASFGSAVHDNEEIMACPIAVDRYVAPTDRTKDYFPPCLVTKTGIMVHETFTATRRDALNAAHGGSQGIASVMDAAALECLAAYREDVPVQYGDELRSSLRLKALYYTDCMMCAHSCRMCIEEGSKESKDLKEEADSLEASAHKAMAVVRRTAERRLEENLNAACRNGSLGAYGTLTRIQRSSALSAAFRAMREVVNVFAQIVPTELAEVAACRLLEKYLTKLCNEVVVLSEISADGCEQIDGILREADNNVATLMKMVDGMEVVRGGALPPPAVQQMQKCLLRLRSIQEILNSRMQDIVKAYREGKFEGLISAEEVKHFIRAIFEDTGMRASFLTELDASFEREQEQGGGDWNNTNW